MTKFGLLVQREDTWFAPRESGFNSPAVHSTGGRKVGNPPALGAGERGFEPHSPDCVTDRRVRLQNLQSSFCNLQRSGVLGVWWMAHDPAKVEGQVRFLTGIVARVLSTKCST